MLPHRLEVAPGSTPRDTSLLLSAQHKGKASSAIKTSPNTLIRLPLIYRELRRKYGSQSPAYTSLWILTCSSQTSW